MFLVRAKPRKSLDGKLSLRTMKSEPLGEVSGECVLGQGGEVEG